MNFTDAQVATSETARDINRGIVLNLIRRRQPISRADLARVSGLQRSTVSSIAEQLIREKWVIPAPTGQLPRGRRPTFLQLNHHRAILMVDLRPEMTSVAVSDVNGTFLAQQGIPTPADPDTAIAKFSAEIRRMMESHPNLIFEGIGVSVPGRFDESRQRVVFAPNLHWPQFDLKEPLEKATGLPVELENTANACVLAEVWFGQGEKTRDLTVVTVSEGVGVGIFSEGRLVWGLNGMAGEFGHIPLDMKGPRCSCGRRGCWEVYASNRAAVRYYESSAASGLGFDDILELAEHGNSQALEALDRMAHAIGRGTRMIVACIAPEEIVFVGEFTRMWNRLGSIIAAEVAESVLPGLPPTIRLAGASSARLRGGLALVLAKAFCPSATWRNAAI